jgi:hypothetical protein
MDADRRGEIEIAKIPAGLLQSLHHKAGDASHDFFVSLVFNDRLIGSGTLVDAWGTRGILTAFHVAKLLDGDKSGRFCLTIAGVPRRFEIPREHFTHIPLGKPQRDGDWPDLSFLKLEGPEALSTLQSKKSFYRVSDKTLVKDFESAGLEKFFWWIVGAPAETSRPMTSTTDEGALMATHLIALAGYGGITQAGEFDRLRVIVRAGEHPSPTFYGGASGGPVWTSVLLLDGPEADLSTAEFTPCHLAGVLFFQGATDEDARTTELFANGPRTLDLLLERQFKP